MRRLALCALLLGCGPTSASVRTGPTLPAKPPECEVRVFLEQRPSEPYEELGQVEAEGTSNFAELIPLLKKEACALGADALVGLRSATGEGYTAAASVAGAAGTASGSSYTKYHTVAIAVRFK